MSKRKRQSNNITGSSRISGFQVFARSNEVDTLSVLKMKWIDMSEESKQHFNVIAKVWNEENTSRRASREAKQRRKNHINQTKSKPRLTAVVTTSDPPVVTTTKKTTTAITENEKRYRSLDPDLVGLGWMEEIFTFEGSVYIVYTGPHGLRCRNLEKAREMAFATRDLDLTCCKRSSWAKTPSKSLEKRSNLDLRKLLASYASTSLEKVKSWKQSRDTMMKRLTREVDERAKKNRNQYKNTKKFNLL